MKNKKELRERRNPFDSEVLKEMNSFKFTFLDNLIGWSIAALAFAVTIFCFYLLSLAFSYLSPTLDNLYSYFLLLNSNFQVLIGMAVAVVIMALVGTVMSIYDQY